jgi:hypothetical protein
MLAVPDQREAAVAIGQGLLGPAEADAGPGRVTEWVAFCDVDDLALRVDSDCAFPVFTDGLGMQP